MVLFPDSPAPVGTKQGSQQCLHHGHPRLYPTWVPPGPRYLARPGAAGGLARSAVQGKGDYSLVPAGIKVGLSLCG